jgi:20S proteasome alpha/beta subunit
VSFSEYITKNLTLYHLSNEGAPLSTHSIASFARGELATALRKGPFQVQTVLGGWDKTKRKPSEPAVENDEGEGSLYFLDYMGTMAKVPYALQGYCSNFCLSILDREWR